MLIVKLYNNIKINKYLININVRSEILRLIHSNFSENSNYVLSKNYIKFYFSKIIISYI